MAQSLRGFKTFTPVRRRGCGSPRALRGEGHSCGSRISQLSTPYMCKCKPSPAALCTHPEVHHVRPGCSNSAASWSWTAERPFSGLEERRCQNGGPKCRVGRTPPKSLEFKNLKRPVSSPLLPPLQLTVLLFSPPSHPPSLSPSPALSLSGSSHPRVSEPGCTAHSLCICLQGLSVSFYFKKHNHRSQRLLQGRDGWGS